MSVVDALAGVGGEVHRRDVLGEQRGDELAAAGGADLLEDGLDVVADRVHGEEEPLGDLGCGDAAGDQLGDLLLARGELVASVMPVLPRGNTNGPTVAIGERAADLIRS